METKDDSLANLDLRLPLEQATVADVGHRALVSVQLDATVGETVRTMQKHGVGSILVLDGDGLRGIFTERDLLTRVVSVGASFEGPLTDVMTPDPIVAKTDEALHVILTRMRTKGLRHLPVINEKGKPTGTISVKRAIHFLTDHLPQAIYNLPPDPDQFPATREGG